MAPGAGFEPARDRINSAAPSQLGYPGKLMVGNLGVEPSTSAIRTQRICRLPRSRNSKLKLGRPIRIRTGISAFGGLCPVPLDDGPEILWGGRRKSNILVDGSTDRRLSTRPRPHLVPATPGELGGRGGNRTPICWLQASGPAVERLPQFLGARGGSRNPNLRFTRAALVRLSYSGAYVYANSSWSGCRESNSVSRTGGPMPSQ